MAEYWIIEDRHRAYILNISRRLYTEERLSGDEMRDFAQILDEIARTALDADALLAALKTRG